MALITNQSLDTIYGPINSLLQIINGPNRFGPYRLKLHLTLAITDQPL